jgi:hypothetical protein
VANIQLQANPNTLPAGSGSPNQSGGFAGDAWVSELHGRWYSLAKAGSLFSGGMGLTSINNATFTTATLGPTCTPIAGVWNPNGSPVNLEILLATLAITMTALAVTGGGPFAWAVSAGNTASAAQITTGLKPFNRKTLQQAGSNAFNMSGVALTGQTNPLVVLGGSAIASGSASSAAFTATAIGIQTQLTGGFELLEGAFLIPPGGILALLATTTPVGQSAASSLLWGEVPTA